MLLTCLKKVLITTLFLMTRAESGIHFKQINGEKMITGIKRWFG
jgi:hypothetical protein